MKRILLAAFFLLAMATQAAAGYSHVQGVYYTDGAGGYYTRQAYTVCVGFRRCVTRYRYVRTNWRPALDTSYSEGWRDRLTKAAVDLKRSAQEHQEFMAATKALGFDGAGLGYGANTNYGGAGLYAQQGNTGYQLRYSTLSELYGQTNTSVLFNQAQNLALATVDLAGQASGQFNAALQMEVAGKSEAARIQAQGLNVAEAIRATAEALKAGTPTARIQTNVYGTPTAPDAPEAEPVTGRHIDVVKHKCGACHGGNSPKGGLWLDGTVGLNLDKFQQAMSNVLQKKMPPEDETPLTPEELGDVLQGLTQMADKEFKPE